MTQIAYDVQSTTFYTIPDPSVPSNSIIDSMKFRYSCDNHMVFHLLLFITIIIVTVSAANPIRRRHSSIHPRRLLQSISKPSPAENADSSFPNSIKLTASNGDIQNYFGDNNQVAISNHNHRIRIVVGANSYANSRGAAYLFVKNTNNTSGHSSSSNSDYTEMAILLANDGQDNDHFGDSVAIDGDTIVVGSNQYYSNGPGAVYVYRIDDTTTTMTISQVAKLTASDGVEKDWFGATVAIRGNYILVGARGVSRVDGVLFGSAYLFGNPSEDPRAPTWTQFMQFQPNDLTERSLFVFSVAMDDDIAVVGTLDENANSLYIFAPVVPTDQINAATASNLVPNPSWTQMAKLTGVTKSYFGSSVAVSGNWIVVGASWDYNTNGMDAGSVVVYTKSTGSSSSWTQMARLSAADGAPFDYFGEAVSISDDASTIVVGVDLHDFNSTVLESGAAYMFRTTNLTSVVAWTQVGKFDGPTDPDTSDHLGRSVAISNNIVAVGVSGDDSRRGSVYILEHGFPSPTPPTTTTPSTYSVATSHPTLSPTLDPAVTTTTSIEPSIDNDPYTPIQPITNIPKSVSPVPVPFTTRTRTPMTTTRDPIYSPINSVPMTEQPNTSSGTYKSGYVPCVIVGIFAIFVACGWLPWWVL